MNKPFFLFAFSTVLILGCQTAIDIDNFDKEAFRSDPNGCLGIRATMKDPLFAADTHFKSLTQEEIYATLGKPDRQELASRSQKYFVYYIDPAPNCADGSDESAPLTLYIRFSATNRASEVKYENY